MKNKSIFIRVDDKEYRDISGEAKKMRMSISSFIRFIFYDWHNKNGNIESGDSTRRVDNN